MSEPPDDFNIPDDANPPDDDNNGDGDKHKPGGPKKRKVKVLMSQNAQEVRFADMFAFTLSPTHGIVKFGVFHPETGEFIVHTQIALTPQGMVAFSQSLTKQLEKVRKNKPGGPRSLN